MSIKYSVYIATSLDGFIARKNGGLDWLPGSDGQADGEDYGFKDFYASVDTLVMGRKTYELALSFGEWPYGGKKVVVLSSAYPKTPKTLANAVQGTCMPPKALPVTEAMARAITKQPADRLQLSGVQRVRSQAIFDAMQKEAAQHGRALLQKERELDRRFAAGTITTQALRTLLAQIRALQAQVRRSHLQAHIGQAALLSKEQITKYDALRGYAAQGGAGAAGHAHRH